MPKLYFSWKKLMGAVTSRLYELRNSYPGFGQGGGPQLLRPKVADIAKRSRASEASILRPGSRARLRALEAFGFLMLKYTFSHILETLFLLFLTSILIRHCKFTDLYPPLYKMSEIPLFRTQK